MSMNSDRLGNAMYDAMMAINMDQNSGEGDDIGRQRMKALASEIISEISANATIAILSTTSIPAGLGPHIHTPATVVSTGSIS